MANDKCRLKEEKLKGRGEKDKKKRNDDKLNEVVTKNQTMKDENI